MPSLSETSDDDALQNILMTQLQTVELLAAQGAVDGQNRQRITLDAISPGLTLQAIGSVSSVLSVSNIIAIAGWDNRQFENPANLLFNSQISDNLDFG